MPIVFIISSSDSCIFHTYSFFALVNHANSVLVDLQCAQGGSLYTALLGNLHTAQINNMEITFVIDENAHAKDE